MLDDNTLVQDTLNFLETCRVRPVPEEHVVGADLAERSALSALGRLMAEVLRLLDEWDRVDDWPEEVRQWLEPDEQYRSVAQRFLAQRLRLPQLAQEIYGSVVRSQHRRALGTFFTPDHVVEAAFDLASTLRAQPPQTAVDPGAGVGAFSLAALGRYADCHVSAIDINTVTLGLLGVSLAATGADADRVRLLRSDFLDLELSGDAGPHLIVGNPPYTRHQEMQAKEKERAHDLFAELVPSRLAGLSTYFLAKTVDVLRPEDYAVLLLPTNWLQCDYGRVLRDRLWAMEKRTIEVHSYDSDSQIFPDARIGAALVGIGPLHSRRRPIVFAKAGDQANRHTPNRRDGNPADWGPANQVRASDAVTTSLPELKTVRVQRGVATGCNDFFLISDRTALRLPTSVLRPLVPRVRSDTTLVDHRLLHSAGKAGQARWIFAATETDLRNDAVAAYVRRGLESGAADGVLTSRRTHWFDLTAELVSAPILIGPMTKSNFRILENDIGAVYTNSFYGIDPGDEEIVGALAGWLRSEQGQMAMRGIARHLGNGLLKLEPRALRTLLEG